MGMFSSYYAPCIVYYIQISIPIGDIQLFSSYIRTRVPHESMKVDKVSLPLAFFSDLGIRNVEALSGILIHRFYWIYRTWSVSHNTKFVTKIFSETKGSAQYDFLAANLEIFWFIKALCICFNEMKLKGRQRRIKKRNKIKTKIPKYNLTASYVVGTKISACDNFE